MKVTVGDPQVGEGITVEDYLRICSMSILDEKACDSEYWERCKSFVENHWTDHWGDLSYKQRDWLIQIKRELLE